MTKVSVYEDNAGGIACIVMEDGKLSNVVLDCEFWEDSPQEVKAALVDGLPYCRDYDPDNYGGTSMEDIAAEIAGANTLIAEATADGVEVYPEAMGCAGRRIFGVVR